MAQVSIENQAVITPAETPGGLNTSKVLAALAVGATLFAASTAEAKTLPVPEGGPVGQVGMSDGFTVSRWAYAEANGGVRAYPSAKSKVRFPLRLLAPDGAPEVYPVESTWRAPNGNEWARIRLPGSPGHPKPSEGWVVRSALGSFGVSHNAIRINRQTERLALYKNGHKVLSTPVGVGRPGLPTPAGNFWVESRYKVDQTKSWSLKGQNISYSVYGPDVIMTSAYSPVNDNWPGGGIIGIHGTNEPWLIPGRPSHGCVRVNNAQIERIYPLATPGTPVIIK